MELESQREGFRKRGLGLAALSYDSTAILEDFARRKSISYPLLSDPESRVIRAFGIQNQADYPPGNLAHGVPYPGTFVIDAKGIVRAKHFEKAYAERQTAASLLALAGETPGVASETTTPSFTLRTSASNASASPGQRVTLLLDFAMQPRMHAYAPGVKGYRPLRLRLDPQPLVAAHETAFPSPRPYRFEPLDETVPVFEDRFRVSQDVTLAGARDLAELLKAPEPEIDVGGTLEYQACSDEICYAPSALPVRWTIKVVPLDRERSPEAIRHQPSKQ